MDVMIMKGFRKYVTFRQDTKKKIGDTTHNNWKPVQQLYNNVDFDL